MNYSNCIGFPNCKDSKTAMFSSWGLSVQATPVETTYEEHFFQYLCVEELSKLRWKLSCYYNCDQDSIHINMNVVIFCRGILSMHTEL